MSVIDLSLFCSSNDRTNKKKNKKNMRNGIQNKLWINVGKSNVNGFFYLTASDFVLSLSN